MWVVYKHRIRRVKYLLEDTYFFSCPSCGSDDTCVVVRHEGESGSPHYHCFECGEGGRYDHCCDCGQLFDPISSSVGSPEPDDGPMNRCPDCFADLCDRYD
jgi:hypothetical protein